MKTVAVSDKKSSLPFINQKYCLKLGLPLDQSFDEFNKANKRYYQEVEDYDWVEVTDNLKGLEAFFHRLRERHIINLYKKFAKKGKVVDVGCGTGLILRHLPKGSIGLDINPRNIPRAKKHAPHAEVILGDVEKLPFKKDSIPMVICTDVLEHFPDPHKPLKEIFRVLSPGGLLIGSVPVKSPIWSLRFLSSTHPGEPFHYLFRQGELVKLLSSYGEPVGVNKGCLYMNCFFAVVK